MSRKLATIKRIDDILPIKDADRIELIIIGGWQVVSQKGHHKGDLVVFYEIDSFIPASDPRYASFSDRFTTWNGKEGMRLKSIKLKKQLSQGMIMPLAEFPEISANAHEGDDVTEVLGIEKWEITEKENTSIMANKTRSFPFFIRKTDQERIQNYGGLVSRALDEEFEVTVKKDGSSMTVFRVDPESKYYDDAKNLVGIKKSWWKRLLEYIRRQREPVYGICSRNVLLPLEGDSNFHKAARNVLMALDSEGEYNSTSYAIQGEVVAPDIQGNYEKVSNVEFHMFDLFDIDNQKYVLPLDRRVFTSLNGIRHVKVVDSGKLKDIVRFQEGDDIVKKLLTYASGPGENPGVDREGVVFKSMTRDFSFKAVSNEYLLKTGK
jgi:RNA ligase (TIGR02306 family)